MGAAVDAAEPLVHIRSFRMDFGSLTVIRDLSFDVHAGETFGPRDGARLGYLPEERGLYKKESVLDIMVYFGRLKGLSRQRAQVWSREYLERVALADKAATRLDKLS